VRKRRTEGGIGGEVREMITLVKPKKYGQRRQMDGSRGNFRSLDFFFFSLLPF
jgi:hypothetical protein